MDNTTNGVILPILPGIIKEYSQLELPDPRDFGYYTSLCNRFFYLDGIIDVEEEDGSISNTGEIIKNIININIEDARAGKPVEERQPIIIAINSCGGSLDLAFSLADCVGISKTPVYTVGVGDVMSAAFVVFLSGEKRMLFKHSQLLIHQGRIGGVEGNEMETKAAIANYTKTLKRLEEYILENSKIDKPTFTKNKRKDWYISAEDAVEKYGIADKIVESIDDIIKVNAKD